MNRLICEFGKRTLVLGDKKYEIEPELAKWLIHNTDIKVVYKMEQWYENFNNSNDNNKHSCDSAAINR